MIIPSIDLMDGKAVQLRRGKEKILEVDDVMKLVKEFRKYGEMAVVDLDAALGRGNNLGMIKKICKVSECRVGGGIRTVEKARELIKAGAKKVIIGTQANKEFLKQLPRDKVIVAVDSRNGKVVNDGWRNETDKNPKQVVRELENYCSGFLCTKVEREGMLEGADLKESKDLIEITKNKITVAGGIANLKEVEELENLGADSQIGMALYNGKISLQEAFIPLLDFKKGGGLIPTIVQDSKGQVIALAYSNQESLRKTLETGKACYYSRSRKKLWMKGEESGNTQKFLNVKYDCDRDALLFTVIPKGFGCHKGKYSCFGEKAFDFQELYEIIQDRIKNPKGNSYTSKLTLKEIRRKINEEAYEIIEANSKERVKSEIADIVYFILVLMAKKGIKIKDVLNELEGRRK